MTQPETLPLAKCPICNESAEVRTHCYQDQINPYDDREPMGLHDEATCSNKRCWMRGTWIPVKQWNRRAPALAPFEKLAAAIEALIEREAYVPHDIDGLLESFMVVRADRLSAVVEEVRGK